MMNKHPELILWNGDIRTQDEARPRARAVALGGGRILAVGSDREIADSAGPETREIDLSGRLVLPGFMDSHFHYEAWAAGRKKLDLSGAENQRDFLEMTASRASSTPPGRWILGQGWNEAAWPENSPPRLADLDRAAPDNPVVLWRCDLHLAMVNSKALEIMGLGPDTPDPPEGLIGRDEQGRPNGLLREAAANLTRGYVPVPDDDELLEIFRAGQTTLHALGLTALQDVRLPEDRAGGARALKTWQRLREKNQLNLRVFVSLAGESLDDFISLGLRTGLGDELLRLGHVKFFADGGMGARTAWLSEPYLDAGLGLPIWDPAVLGAKVRRAHQAGLAVMIHAIGDRAVSEVMDIFESIPPNGAGPGPSLRHRLEHLQLLQPSDAARLGGLGIVADVQPPNLPLDLDMIDECVGARSAWAYAFRTILDSGAPVLFSSDAPVCNPAPLAGIHAAVTRATPQGRPRGGWRPEQKVTVEEAVRAYTIAPARAHGLGGETGGVSPGKRADLIVLDSNIYEIAPEEIIKARVDLTFFSGKKVFDRAKPQE
ncbi:MAG: amidohydrolase [Pseudomonadota bacterium]